MNLQDLTLFRLGDRVELHPATDRWMMGDIHGTVELIGKKYLGVKMDRSGKSIRISPDNIGKLNGAYL